ncbi:hypothetical protein FCIRC_884 [Fusarium circinatum]|uniref:Uncharacterized protein n=1 Tax=Fusarium circinatum TaxID=48490 RepID=A0A8H5UJX0_FUSCI|nr:hypothetical protein FCIRC_884 [Fusarium circinatum]
MASIGAEEGQSPYLTPHTCEHCQKIDLYGTEEEVFVSHLPGLDWKARDSTRWHFSWETMAFTGIGLDDLDKGSRAGCSLGKYLLTQFNKGPLTPELKIYIRANAFYGLIPVKHMVTKAEVLEFEIWSPEHTNEGSAVSSDPRFDNCYVFSPAHKPHGLFDGGMDFVLATEKEKGKSTRDLRSHTLFTPDIEKLAESERRVTYSKPMLADPLAQDAS